MIGNLGQGPPKVGGLLEAVDVQARVINALARYIEELRAFYANRCEQLERQIFGEQPSPTFPAFDDWMKQDKPISTEGSYPGDLRDLAQDRHKNAAGAYTPNFRG